MQQALPDMELRIVSGAGHSMYDPKIRSQLVDASDRMLNLSGMSIRPPPSDFPSAALC